MEEKNKEIKTKNRILSALFDVRPVTQRGDLDIERIKRIEKILNLREAKTHEETKRRDKAIKVKLVDQGAGRERIIAVKPIKEIKEILTKEKIH
jgi:hypothetical protein